MVEKRGINLHISPTPLVSASRIFRETAAVAESNLFDHVYLIGTSDPDLANKESIDEDRTIQRVGSSRPRPRKVAKRLLKQALWSIKVFRVGNRLDVKVVNAHSIPVLPVSAAIAIKKRAKLIYDTHELETEAAAAQGTQKKIFKFVEKKLIGSTSAVFTVNESIRDWYKRTYPTSNVISIVNVPDRQSLEPNDSDKAPNLREVYGLSSEERLFIHVGFITRGRHIVEIVEAFAQRKNDHVVFLGDGRESEIVDLAASKYHNIHRYPAIPSHLVPSAVASCDVGLCLIPPVSLSDELSLPNKAIEYLAGGIPFLFTDLPEVEKLIPDIDMEVWKVKDPSNDLLSAVARIDQEAIQRARAAVNNNALPSWDEESEKMIAEYHKLLLQ